MEHPKMLYRSGSEIEWEGKQLDTLVVADADEEAAARADGWMVAEAVINPDPLDGDGDGKPGGSRPRRKKADAE